MEDFLQLRVTDFKEKLSKISRYSKRYDWECCGISTKEKVFFLENIAQDKNNFFSIDPSDYFRIIQSHKIEFIWHSHPYSSCVPSYADVDYSNEFCQDFLIYSVKDDNFCFFDYKNQESVYFSF